MPVGTVTLAPVTNRRLTWRTSAVCSASGPTMIPGVSQRKSERQVEGVAQLHEAGRLVGPVGVDGAGQVHRVVGDHAHRASLDPDQRGDHAERRSRGRSSSTEPTSAMASTAARTS